MLGFLLVLCHPGTCVHARGGAASAARTAMDGYQTPSEPVHVLFDALVLFACGYVPAGLPATKQGETDLCQGSGAPSLRGAISLFLSSRAFLSTLLRQTKSSTWRVASLRPSLIHDVH